MKSRYSWYCNDCHSFISAAKPREQMDGCPMCKIEKKTLDNNYKFKCIDCGIEITRFGKPILPNICAACAEGKEAINGLK